MLYARFQFYVIDEKIVGSQALESALSVLHDELRTGCQSLLPIFKCVSNEIKNDRMKLIEKIIEYQKKEKENEKERERNKQVYCLEIDKIDDKIFNSFSNNGDDSMQLTRTVSLLEREEKKKNLLPYSQSTYSMNSVRSHSPSVTARKGATYASSNTTSNSSLRENIPYYDGMNYNNSKNNSINNNDTYNNNSFNKSTIRRRDSISNLNSSLHNNSNNFKNQEWQS